ncbi:hypothetical protein M6I34_06245 [Burkholderiaceae bacterium FT117]|uniref:hypothetical protein n=1 Tax=Zeimonas sediminis TaxID=2944268 RepID=UPI0023430C08|nr:hypothetical protein [Zeimonas sediminis]MCM5570102.1 hypothetical protein [Zeimonas sediminis]
MRWLARLALCAGALAMLTGCAATIGEPAARRQMLDAFLAQPHRFVVFAPAGFRMDEQLKVLGLERRGDPVVERFDPVRPLMGVAERIVAANPLLANGSTGIAVGREVGALRLDPAQPVLFLHATWKLVYRRLPPDLWRYRLQAGIVAKIVPLGQVLSGEGALNLPTAAWHEGCAVDAFDGAFLHIAEWTRDEGGRLDEAIAEVQAECGAGLGASLARALSRRAAYQSSHSG